MGNWGWSYLSSRDKRAILQGIRDGGVHGGPYHVEIQPSDRCEIDCEFCSTKGHRRDDELPLSLLEPLVREMRTLGARAVTLCGGGEPLFYRHRARMFDLLGEAGIVLDHVTTNGVGLSDECARSLVALRCGSIIVSLSASDPTSYARIVRRPERTFHRIVDNVRSLVERRGWRLWPRINVQFMIYRETYRSIPAMYELAASIGADQILFREPWQPPSQGLTDEETAEMLRLFEQVLLQDQFLRVGSIQSFQRNLSAPLGELHRRVQASRTPASSARRLWTLLRAKEWPWHAKLRQRALQRWRPGSPALVRMSDGCVSPWLTLTVRADGSVPACCVLQANRRGHLAESTLREIWYGEAFAALRRQMRRTIELRDAWSPEDPAGLHLICAWDRTDGPRCNFRNFYYFMDHGFLRELHLTTAGVRGVPPEVAAAEARPVPAMGI